MALFFYITLPPHLFQPCHIKFLEYGILYHRVTTSRPYEHPSIICFSQAFFQKQHNHLTSRGIEEFSIPLLLKQRGWTYSTLYSPILENWKTEKMKQSWQWKRWQNWYLYTRAVLLCNQEPVSHSLSINILLKYWYSPSLY